MGISEFDLMKMATAYIENGILRKWRYDSDDKNSMYYKLNIKSKSGELVTKEELSYISNFANVVIVEEQMIQFINFSGDARRY